MSSLKRYTLEVLPDDDENLVTFTVKSNPLFFLKYIRVPLISILAAYLVPTLILHAQDNRLLLWPSVSLDFQQKAQWFLRGGYAYYIDFTVALLISAVVVLLLCLQDSSDSIIVMKHLGVQISSKSRWRFLNHRNNKEFIPLSEIIDIVIHEGFHGYGQVIFYMCVLTKAQGLGNAEGNGIKVVFPNFLPRKDILLQAWRHSRKILYGDHRRHFRHVPGQGLREIQHLHQ